jgi:hypothetical protein
MNTRSNESLGPWKSSREFRTFLFRQIIPALKEAGGTDLAQQLQDTSSTTITEGYGRYDYGKHGRFCTDTQQSLLECVKLLAQAHVEKLLTDDLYTESLTAANEALTLLDSYSAHLERAQKSLLTTPA